MNDHPKLTTAIINYTRAEIEFYDTVRAGGSYPGTLQQHRIKSRVKFRDRMITELSKAEAEILAR